MSIVEAARAGLVLLISDAGVAGELFVDGKSALIFKPRDVLGLWHCMEKVFWNRDIRDRLSRASLEVARKSKMSFAEYKRLYCDNLTKSATRQESRVAMLTRNIFARYVISGCSAAFSQIGLLYVFTDIAHIWYLYSSALAFIVALCISFSMQKFWTFKNRGTDKMHHQFFKYTLVGLFGIALNSGLMYAFVDLLGIHYLVSQIIVGFIIMFFNFLLYRLLIFK
jgi:putative flippase GtrA